MLKASLLTVINQGFLLSSGCFPATRSCAEQHNVEISINTWRLGQSDWLLMAIMGDPADILCVLMEAREKRLHFLLVLTLNASGLKCVALSVLFFACLCIIYDTGMALALFQVLRK